MNTCLCGNTVDQEGASCERCAALHILGLDSTANYREIEKTYRVLVKVWHPDRFQTDPKLKEAADEKLKSINAAYAYLRSAPEPRGRKRSKKAAVQEVRLQAAPVPRRRSPLDLALVSGILLRCVILLLGLAIPALILFGLDRWLSSSPTTASFYTPYRSRVLFSIRTDVTAAKQSFAQSLHRLLPSHTASSSAQTAQAPDADPASTAGTANAPSVTVPTPHVPMPYVTVGLTAEEVTTVMGAPLAATGSSLRYKNAVFYFHKGLVSGWNVDPALIPLHVKLWPSGHSDSHLAAFTIGSSRSDVIAVQGTPTLLSENKMAYGRSEIFFEEGHVIGWNDSHGSERLRVAPR